MIKCIAFDIGGVLFHGQYTKTVIKLADSKGIEREEMKKYAFPLYDFVFKGNMSETDFFRMIIKHFELDEDPSALTKELETDVEKLTDVWEIVEKLKTRYKTGIISDIGVENAHYREREFHLAHWFDYIVYSYQEHTRKPDLKMFKIFIERSGFEASEIVFIDDMERNIDAAKEVGMKGILFKDAVGLDIRLRSLGLDL